MTATQIAPPPVRADVAYDALAGAYDVLTGDYRHDLWLDRIERLALAAGLRGRRVLDVACGTGKSFLPLLRRGYALTACDISERMVRIARRKAPAADISVADMRRLGVIGQFDLITCLDDAVNYLLTSEDLDGFLDGLARNLAPDGIAVFDVNSLLMYRTGFASDWIAEDPVTFVAWTARDAATTEPGDLVDAVVHVFARTGDTWSRRESRHRQRHWPAFAIEAAARRAGLRIVAAHGQHRGAVIDDHFGELEHTKALYLLCHQPTGGDEMTIGGV